MVCQHSPSTPPLRSNPGRPARPIPAPPITSNYRRPRTLAGADPDHRASHARLLSEQAEAARKDIVQEYHCARQAAARAIRAQKLTLAADLAKLVRDRDADLQRQVRDSCARDQQSAGAVPWGLRLSARVWYACVAGTLARASMCFRHARLTDEMKAEMTEKAEAAERWETEHAEKEFAMRLGHHHWEFRRVYMTDRAETVAEWVATEHKQSSAMLVCCGCS